jgi:hypothetical protein
MPQVAAGLLVWLGLLALPVTVRMLRGDIRVTGFLSHSLNANGGAVAPERVASMITFPLVIVLYTLDALHADVSGATGRPSLPEVPQYLLALLTGSNGLYLAGKISRNT